MPLRVVVPVDGSQTSEHALRWGLSFARRTGATMSVCSVVDPMLACMAGAAGASLDPGPMLEALETDAENFCAAALTLSAAEQISTTTAVLHGMPAEAIDAYARTCDADIIVLGTHARRGLALGMLGSVTGAVVRSSRVAVLAVRTETVLTDIGPIVVAVDDSESSAAAARFALKIAQALGVPIHLVHVFAHDDRLRIRSLEHSVVQELVPTASQVALAIIAGEAVVAGVTCTTEIRHGNITEALIAATAERDGSILATGTHGRGTVGRLFLGSVAEGLMRYSVVPVLIVRSAE